MTDRRQHPATTPPLTSRDRQGAGTSTGRDRQGAVGTRSTAPPVSRPIPLLPAFPLPHPGAPGRLVATRGAFTLIEVLVVVIVMGIAAMVVVPQMLRDGSLTVQGAARMIIADLLVAQNEAIARHSPHAIVFEPEQNRYRIVDAEGGTVTLPVRDGPYVVDFDLDARFRGVRIEAAEFGDTARVEFDELGGPVPIGGGSIDIAAGVHRYRIQVAPFTGRVTVHPF